MRNVIGLPLALFGAVLTVNAATAATVIETVAGEARAKSLMTVERDRAKMQSEPSNYILIDPSAGNYLYVVQQTQQVVQMNSAPPRVSGRPVNLPPLATVKLVNKGAGPKIAGFATQRYQLYANGELCATTYLSRDAMKRGQLQDFLTGFHRLHAKQKQEYRAAGAQSAPCDDAQENLMGRYPQLGLAMRTVDAEGQLRQEVVNIQTGIVVSNSFFQAPDGFARITHEEFLRQMEGGASGGQPPSGEKPAREQETAPADKKAGNS